MNDFHTQSTNPHPHTYNPKEQNTRHIALLENITNLNSASVRSLPILPQKHQTTVFEANPQSHSQQHSPIQNLKQTANIFTTSRISSTTTESSQDQLTVTHHFSNINIDAPKETAPLNLESWNYAKNAYFYAEQRQQEGDCYLPSTTLFNLEEAYVPEEICSDDGDFESTIDIDAPTQAAPISQMQWDEASNPNFHAEQSSSEGLITLPGTSLIDLPEATITYI